MSTIKEVQELLKESTKPILMPLQQNKGFNAFIIGMDKGMILKSHKAKWPSRLTILSGEVNYFQAGENYSLGQFDEQHITPNVLHEVTAIENSLCLLTQSKPD